MSIAGEDYVVVFTFCVNRSWKMNSLKLTAAAAALVFSGAALADPDRPDWTYGEIFYNQGSTFNDDTGGDTNNDAFGATLSMSGWDYVHLQAEFLSGTTGSGLNTDSGDTDFDQYTITLGVHPSIGDGTDLLFEVNAGNIDPDDLIGNADADFWGLAGGFRHMMTQRFEINGKVNYQDLDNIGVNGLNSDSVGSTSNDYASLGGQFNWNAFSGGLTYTIDDPIRDSDVVELNFRYSFADFF
jgi:hypothetical protein